MSYVKKAVRDTILQSPVGNCDLENGKELSFAVLTLLKQFTKDNKSRYDEAVGAIERAKSEFQRTVVTPEDMQRQFDHGE